MIGDSKSSKVKIFNYFKSIFYAILEMNIAPDGKTNGRTYNQTDIRTDRWIVGQTDSWYSQLFSAAYFAGIVHSVRSQSFET